MIDCGCDQCGIRNLHSCLVDYDIVFRKHILSSKTSFGDPKIMLWYQLVILTLIGYYPSKESATKYVTRVFNLNKNIERDNSNYNRSKILLLKCQNIHIKLTKSETKDVYQLLAKVHHKTKTKLIMQSSI